MALLHEATLTPTKPEALAAWVPTQLWALDHGDLELVGAFRFDDPDGVVGLEVHLVRLDGILLQVPLTYRGEALEGAEPHLVTTMDHSALGPRWVYDGLRDPVMTTLLAAAALTGTGQAVSLVHRDGRTGLVPSAIRLAGGGWNGGPVVVDGFELVEDAGPVALLRNGRMELCVARRPTAGPTPAIGLTATWVDQAEPVVLAEVVAS